MRAVARLCAESPEAIRRSRWLLGFRSCCILLSLLPMVLALFAWAPPAWAVLIASGDGAGNTTDPGFFGWDYVGDVNGLTGTYLGNGWVITANHVGPGDFTLDGVVYPWVSGSDVQLRTNGSTLADLVVFSIYPYPLLDPLEIRTTPPPVGEFLIMIGCGRDRGSDTSWDPNGAFPPPPDEISGWSWAGTHSKRWGTNEMDSLTAGLIANTVSFYTVFDEGLPLPEAQAANGDSGGAVFSINAIASELAGIIYVIGPTPGQPSETALYTNLTFIARLDFYRDEIVSIAVAPDMDSDGVEDLLDNCIDVANAGQGDINGDGVGDACEPFDFDGDGWPDLEDNCSGISNPGQEDADQNGIGDVCEAYVVPAISELGLLVLVLAGAGMLQLHRAAPVRRKGAVRR
ncbi:MAG: hypothetical protein GY944_19820 [bacterium]|nr:hypothetical protein [bacterium]